MAEVVRRSEASALDRLDLFAALMATGDLMQSGSSRVVAWVRSSGVDVPYEVAMALLEVEATVDRWTELRRQHRAV